MGGKVKTKSCDRKWHQKKVQENLCNVEGRNIGKSYFITFNTFNSSSNTRAKPQTLSKKPLKGFRLE
jgi:hypothetical protein